MQLQEPVVAFFAIFLLSLCWAKGHFDMFQDYTFENFWYPIFSVWAFITAVYACLYLLFRKGNMFNPEIQSPVRLRRWTAAFISTIALSHLWWELLYYSPIAAKITRSFELCLLLDTVTALPAMMFTLHAMLQDRKRPIWPILIALAIGMLYIYLYTYFKSSSTSAVIILSIVLVLYIFFLALHYVRQYQRWLRENYADLEHKEVLTSVAILIAFMITISGYYFFVVNSPDNILIELIDIILIIFLLWRVESIQTLEEPEESQTQETISGPSGVFAKIDIMLQKHCVEEQYYLRHDTSLSQLSKLIGTNNTYLSQYFSKKGLSYNTYINGLRVQHFIRLYEEALTTGRIFTASQLAYESGFQSYSTFGEAFKQAKGKTVTAWMRTQQQA